MNTGVYRRIDDLGRIVIPKEIRRKIHIDTGDMMEISVVDGKVVLTAYSPLSDASFTIEACLRALSQEEGILAVVTNKSAVLLSLTEELPKYSELSDELQALIYQHKEYSSNGVNPIYISDLIKHIVIAMFPIKKFGELYGSLVLLSVGNATLTDLIIEKGRLTADIISAAVSEIE